MKQQALNTLRSKIYDPNSEVTEIEKAIAGHWECLRRNSKFRSLAQHWLKDEEFRFAHVLSNYYHSATYHTPRCALDWMLTSAERVRLAKYQVEKLCWFFDPNYNFGPMVCHQRFSAAGVNRKNLAEFLHVEPMANAPIPVSVDQSWGAAPELFRKQFRIAHGSPDTLGEANERFHEIGRILRVVAGKLAAGDPLKEVAIIADTLFAIGSELRDSAEFSKIFKVPRMRYSEKRFAALLQSIRESFRSENLLMPTKAHDIHQSYQGTTEDWRWFLKAESLGLKIDKTADALKLAELYSQDLRARTMRGTAPRRARAEGFSGSKFSSRVLKNRRITVKRHVRSIQKWIESVYPSRVASPAAS